MSPKISTLAAVSLLAMASLSTAADAHTAPTDLHVLSRLPLGGTGGWDYLTVDAAHQRLFVSRGDRVMVVDLPGGTLAATLPGTDGVHGIALAPSLHRGFVSDGHASAVTVFDLDTLKVLETIHGTGKNPDAILFDNASRHVFTFNGGSHSASVIDPASHAVIATVALPGKPEFAQADGAGHVYVNIEDRSELVELDSLHDRVLHTWSLSPCESPSGLALDNAHHRLFSVCDNETLAVTDARSGKGVAHVPIGDGPDAVAFDPSTATIYSSNGESGTLTVVHQDDPDHYSVTATVPTQISARTEALDPTTHRLYLSAATPGPETDARGRHTMLPGSFTLLVVGRR